MKKNKITVAVLILSLLCNLTAFATDIEQEVITGLQELGIVEESDDLRLDEYMTKAEAIKMISVATGLTPIDHVKTAKEPFVDVPLTHWAIKYITVCEWDEIINGDDNGYFYPENAVTSQEMQKMLVAALGYISYAENLGGYPKGYLAFSSSLKIKEGISVENTEPLTRSKAMKMMNNALDVPIMECKSYVEENGETTHKYYVRDGGQYSFMSLRMQLNGLADNNS